MAAGGGRDEGRGRGRRGGSEWVNPASGRVRPWEGVRWGVVEVTVEGRDGGEGDGEGGRE